MKKTLSLLLIAVLLLTLSCCSQSQQKLRQPVSFYYRRAELTYSKEDSVICVEQREGDGFEDLSALLQAYLQGPLSDTYADTFPSGTQLISILINGTVAELVISSQLSNLSALDRNIACSCICMTVMNLTDAQSVRIRIDGGLTQQSYLFDIRNHEIILVDEAASS